MTADFDFTKAYLDLIFQRFGDQAKKIWESAGQSTDEIQRALADFKLLKDQGKITGPDRDIQLWQKKPFSWFKEFVQMTKKMLSKTEVERSVGQPGNEVGGAMFVPCKEAQDFGYDLVFIPSYEAAQFYGRKFRGVSQNWCISTSNPTFFYYRYGNSVFFFLVKRKSLISGSDIYAKVAVQANVSSNQIIYYDKLNDPKGSEFQSDQEHQPLRAALEKIVLEKKWITLSQRERPMGDDKTRMLKYLSLARSGQIEEVARGRQEDIVKLLLSKHSLQRCKSQDDAIEVLRCLDLLGVDFRDWLFPELGLAFAWLVKRAGQTLASWSGQSFIKPLLQSTLFQTSPDIAGKQGFVFALNDMKREDQSSGMADPQSFAYSREELDLGMRAFKDQWPSKLPDGMVGHLDLVQDWGQLSLRCTIDRDDAPSILCAVPQMARSLLYKVKTLALGDFRSSDTEALCNLTQIAVRALSDQRFSMSQLAELSSQRDAVDVKGCCIQKSGAALISQINSLRAVMAKVLGSISTQRRALVLRALPAQLISMCPELLPQEELRSMGALEKVNALLAAPSRETIEKTDPTSNQLMAVAMKLIQLQWPLEKIFSIIPPKKIQLKDWLSLIFSSKARLSLVRFVPTGVVDAQSQIKSTRADPTIDAVYGDWRQIASYRELVTCTTVAEGRGIQAGARESLVEKITWTHKEEIKALVQSMHELALREDPSLSDQAIETALSRLAERALGQEASQKSQTMKRYVAWLQNPTI